ncbi:MAG: NfeD family protein [Cyanobacteria bacterium P01_F01_bin.3]
MLHLQWLKSLTPSLTRDAETALSPTNAYLQGTGIIEDPIRIGRSGRIRLHGVYWSARSSSEISRILAVGETVLIVARDGLTLIVEPANPYCELALSKPRSAVQDLNPHTRRAA